jgi:hypothetical protein
MYTRIPNGRMRDRQTATAHQSHGETQAAGPPQRRRPALKRRWNHNRNPHTWQPTKNHGATAEEGRLGGGLMLTGAALYILSGQGLGITL